MFMYMYIGLYIKYTTSSTVQLEPFITTFKQSFDHLNKFSSSSCVSFFYEAFQLRTLISGRKQTNFCVSAAWWLMLDEKKERGDGGKAEPEKIRGMGK